ncbi:MAG: RNA polymerase sigma-70 factor [Prolixibacteraceae bacterium]
MVVSNHDYILLEGLKEGNVKIYDYIFHFHYSGMVVFVQKYIPDQAVADDIVQDFFVKLWINREHLNIETSLKSYFFASLKNRCIDHLRHEVIKGKAEKNLLEKVENLNDERNLLIESELRDQINLAIDKLPPACKEIFIMNRFEGLKPAEIALKKGISVRTVETHIGKALKILKRELSLYLPASLVAILLGSI